LCVVLFIIIYLLLILFTFDFLWEVGGWPVAAEWARAERADEHAFSSPHQKYEHNTHT